MSTPGQLVPDGTASAPAAAARVRHDPRAADRARVRAAHLISELFAPWVCAGVLPVLVGALATAPWWRGALSGALTALLSAVVPYLLVVRAVRSGRLTDRHVSRRQDRPLLLALATGFVLVALVAVRALSGPPDLLVLILAMLVSAAVGMAVSLWWKVSLHALVITGSAVLLVELLGPWAVLSLAAVAAVGWARVVLRAHTPAQVLVGTALGALVAAALTPLT